MKKESFPPIVDDNSKLLILGTMPGEQSLKAKEYYANSTNQFWRILSAITGDNFQTDYSTKKDLLLKNKIAIWDVLMHCEREGSLDVNISDEYPNDFTSFFKKYPDISHIFFNGGKAEKCFKKYSLYDYSKKYNALPSTSSANTSKTLNEKIKIWQNQIKK
ncbi:MAG: DNA-deoxyinosine glycosylase [Melioribacteraceae bacterium]